MGMVNWLTLPLKISVLPEGEILVDVRERWRGSWINEAASSNQHFARVVPVPHPARMVCSLINKILVYKLDFMFTQVISDVKMCLMI